jgi:hypothetical protein
MPYEQPKKPVREALESIRDNMDDVSAPRGVFNPRIVNRIAFVVTLLSLLSTTALLLAIIWNALDPTLGFRCIGTVLVVLLAVLMFRGINNQFTG